jgi:hypothetical protein
LFSDALGCSVCPAAILVPEFSHLDLEPGLWRTPPTSHPSLGIAVSRVERRAGRVSQFSRQSQGTWQSGGGSRRGSVPQHQSL